MKDHLIDNGASTTKFDDASLQFDNAEPSTLLRCKAIGRLVIGLQNKLPLCVQRHAMGGRATLEISDAPCATTRIRTVARGKTYEHDVLDHRLDRRRETDNVSLAIGEESYGKSVR